MKPVEVRARFVEIENELLRWWYKDGVVEEYLVRNSESKKKFSFLDGPITANNPMGVHHGWGRTIKDLYQRYHNMIGEKQRFQNGFDCQGLWVEVEVEKELGFKDKKDIEKFGIDKFVEKCKERVSKYSSIQTEQSKRLGYFMDWDNSYFTMSDDNNYTIWHVLKTCWERGWLYKGLDVVAWCTRCGTAISQHEILTEEYKEIVHKAIFVKFPIVEGDFKGKMGISTEDEVNLLIWTTTAWTVPGNVGVAVNPELTYMVVKDEEDGKWYVLLGEEVVEGYSVEKLLKRAGVSVGDLSRVKKFKGEELEGVRYRGPYSELEVVKKAREEFPDGLYKVVTDKDLVGGDEGTALVHMSTGTGKEDFKIGKEKGLAFFLVVDDRGRYLDQFGDLSGKNAIGDPDLIIKYLKENGYLKKVERYRHRYPTCWRCKEELIFRAVDEWYIAMDRKDPSDEKRRTLREGMIETAKMIKWIPGFGLERELDWLRNMDDWLISKKRYWGLALPIWECECGEFVVIGSKRELKEKAAGGYENFEGHSPHRPWIDKVEVKCPKCGKKAKRVEYVGNPWLDAGIVSFSTLVDPKTGEVSYLGDKKYWREWFPADFITECFPGQFKNWFYSLIAMSTVLEKTNPFKILLGFGSVKDEKGDEMHKSKGNAIWFDEAAEKMGVDVIRWVYAVSNPSLNVNFGYRLADKTRRRFHLIIWNVYRFFVSYVLFDGWEEKKGMKSDNVLDRWILSRLNGVVKEVTDDLDKYRHNKGAEKIEKFVDDLSTWYLRRSRERVGPKAEDEKDKMNFYETMNEVLVSLSKLLAPFNPFISETIYKNLTGERSVHLADWPKANMGLVDEDIEVVMSAVRDVCERGHSVRKVEGLRVRQPLSVAWVKDDKFEKMLDGLSGEMRKQVLKLVCDELNVKKVEIKKGDKLDVELDIKITEELKKEAEVRELIRKIQFLRKKAEIDMNEEVVVYLPDYPKEFEGEIKKTTLTKEIKKGEMRVEK